MNFLYLLAVLFFTISFAQIIDKKEETCTFDYGHGLLICCPVHFKPEHECFKNTKSEDALCKDCFYDKVYEKAPICDEKVEECQSVKTCCFEGNRGTIKVKTSCFTVHKQIDCNKPPLPKTNISI